MLAGLALGLALDSPCPPLNPHSLSLALCIHACMLSTRLVSVSDQTEVQGDPGVCEGDERQVGDSKRSFTSGLGMVRARGAG